MIYFNLRILQFTFNLAFIFISSLQVTVAQQPATAQEEGTIKPLVRIQKEDYATARKQFKTILIKQGSSPQKTSTADSADQPPQGVTQILFKSGDLKLKAWINKPDTISNKKYPVVIFLHGGFAFGKGDWDMTKPFRDSGFIVIAPILRGENGQPGIFTLFYDEVNDVIAAAGYASMLPFIDKTKMYIAGHSVGGTLALLSAMSANYFKKAASFSGSPDQVLYCRYGIPAKIIPFDTLNAKEFELRSPMSYAGSFKCPVRMYFGSREPHWKLSTQQTVDIARKKGLDADLVQVEGGHEDAVPEEMKLAIKFFNQN